MKKFTTLILGCFCLVVIASVFVFINAGISGFVTTIAKAKEGSFSTDARDQALKRADVLITETALNRAELATFVVSDSDSVRLIDTIETTAKREHVTLTIGSVSVVPTEWTYHELVRVVFSARGSLTPMTRFVSAIETLPEASRLVNVSFEVSDTNLWFATFTVDFIKEKSLKP